MIYFIELHTANIKKKFLSKLIKMIELDSIYNFNMDKLLDFNFFDIFLFIIIYINISFN